jgi:hypothetical protein
MNQRLAAADTLTIEAVVKHAYSGAVRILTDSERFGLDIVDFSLVSQTDGGGVVRFAVSRTSTVDPAVLCARFARHPSIGSIQVVEADVREQIA